MSANIPEGAAPQLVAADAAGQFIIDGVPPGVYLFQVSRTGYVADQHKMIVSVTVPPSGGTVKVTLTLLRQAAITGVIRDENGLPIQNAQVTLLRESVRRGRRVRDPCNLSGSSTPEGQFRIAGVAPGRYILSVDGQTTAAARRAHSAFPKMYYPGVREREAAQVIEARAGEEQQVDIWLRSAPAVRIRGRVTPAVPSHFVILGEPSETPTLSIRIEDSSFELTNVTAGIYPMTVTANSGGVSLRADRVITVGDTNIDNLVVALAPLVKLTGSVQRLNTNQEAQVVLFSGPPSIALNSLHGLVGCKFTEASQFQCEGLIPGETYWIEPGGHGSYFIQSATYNGRDALVEGIPASGEGGSLDVVLSDRTAVLTRTVTGAEKQSDGDQFRMVVLQRVGDRYVWNREEMSVPDTAQRLSRTPTDTPLPPVPHRFRLDGLGAGTYLVFALPLVAEVPYLEPDFLRDHASEGQTVALKKGETREISVKLLGVQP